MLLSQKRTFSTLAPRNSSRSGMIQEKERARLFGRHVGERPEDAARDDVLPRLPTMCREKAAGFVFDNRLKHQPLSCAVW